jgi:hypothetical protein
MSSDEIAVLVKRAVDKLELALDAYVKKNMDEAKLKVWEASVEAEYALFLLEQVNEFEFSKTVKSDDRASGDVDFGAYIVKAQDLFKEALEDYKKEKNSEAAHHKVWLGRGFLIILQEKIEKGKI